MNVIVNHLVDSFKKEDEQTAFLRFLKDHCRNNRNNIIMINNKQYNYRDIQEIIKEIEAYPNDYKLQSLLNRFHLRGDPFKESIPLKQIHYFTRGILKKLNALSITETSDLKKIRESVFMDIWKRKDGFHIIVQILIQKYHVKFAAERIILKPLIYQSDEARIFLSKQIDRHTVSPGIKRVLNNLKKNFGINNFVDLYNFDEYRLRKKSNYSKKSWNDFLAYLESNQVQLTKA